MSYSVFLDELNEYYKYNKQLRPDFKPTMDEALNSVRDNWLVNGKFKELVSFILQNWDSGNCDEFMKPLVDILIKENKPTLFKQLWKGVLRNRVDKVWNNLEILKESYPYFVVEELDKIDLANFNQFSSKEDIWRRVAFHSKYTLNGISEFISGLTILNQNEEIIKANQFFQTIFLLQKPDPKPTTDKRALDEEVFWKLIDQSRLESTDSFDFLDKLKLALEAFKPTEIRKFQKLLLYKQQELYTWEHWALAYISRKGCGDDEFDYFRVWAVSKGKSYFEIIKRIDTSRLLEVFDEDPQLEDLFYLVEEVYESKTGELMKPVKVKQSKLKGNSWNEDALEKDFSVLCKLFNY